MMNAMALYLITGIGGFIGSSLARALLSRGEKVRGVDNFATGKLENIGDILDHIEFTESNIQMLRGEQPTILGDGEQSRDFTYIDNAVEANLLACQAPAPQAAGRVFNVATGRRITLNETFKQLQGLTSYSGEPKYEAE